MYLPLPGRAFTLLGLVVVCAAMTPAAADAQSRPAAVALQAASAMAVPSARVGRVPDGTVVSFDMDLALKDPAGAQAWEQAVSQPGNVDYRHFLTAGQWEERFSPSPASVDSVSRWLRGDGLTVGAVSADRMSIHVTGTAKAIRRAFRVGLGEYRVSGRVVRRASGPLLVPSSIAGITVGVTGLDEDFATSASATPTATGPTTSARQGSDPSRSLPPPAGYRQSTQCSSYYGQRLDRTAPPYGPGYPEPQPYVLCGYTPPQLQSAYGLRSRISAGDDGSGVTVAVVLWYASPSLFSDAQTYSRRHQPGQVLSASQFHEVLAPTFDEIQACGGSNAFGEQSLDVEAVHATAPGARILYEGAADCSDAGIDDALADVIDHHRADVISNSYYDIGGELAVPAGVRRAEDDLFLMAGGTGIGVLYASGDSGDDFTELGMTATNYPASSPYVTAVGGTTLKIDARGRRTAEIGWSDGGSTLCNRVLLVHDYPGCDVSTLGTWFPEPPGPFASGGGGGTSYLYAEPGYERSVVPSALANRHRPVTGIANRVLPDISMDADSGTGMLVGLTEAFPGGDAYDESAFGGTSLSSPLFAGVMADADQAAGGALGFADPALYALAAQGRAYAGASAPFHDDSADSHDSQVFAVYWNGLNKDAGSFYINGTLDFQGTETYCSATGTCRSRRAALTAAPGFDSMTGIGSPGPGFLAALSG